MASQKKPSPIIPKRVNKYKAAPKKKPTDYRVEVTPEQIAEAEAMGALGMNTQQICAALGWPISSFYYWIHSRPELGLLEAISRGKAKGVRLVAQKLMATINNLDARSIQFYLRTQAGWRENIGIVGGDGGAVKVEHTHDLTKLSNKELDALELLLEKAGVTENQ